LLLLLSSAFRHCCYFEAVDCLLHWKTHKVDFGALKGIPKLLMNLDGSC